MILATRRSVVTGLFALPVAVAMGKDHVPPFCHFSLNGGWGDDGRDSYITHEAKPNDKSGVPQVVKNIEKVFGFNVPIHVMIAAQEDNAYATVAGNKKILIVDVGFLEKVNQYAGTEWSAISIIAHEIGHHIAGFVGPSHTRELNADYWSGQALQRLHAARDASTAAILTFGTELDTQSHPNKYRRRDVILKGWDDAASGRIDYSHCDSCEG